MRKTSATGTSNNKQSGSVNSEAEGRDKDRT